jgi:hypothetical protein
MTLNENNELEVTYKNEWPIWLYLPFWWRRR